MREMKDSGIEWIGAIPTTWHTKKMKYISNFIQNKYSSDYGLLPYIGLENIASWSGSFISTNSQYDREQSLICEPEDILFGKLRPYLAKVYMNDRLCCCSNEFAVIRVNGQNKRYMWYQLLSHGFIFEIDRSTYGTKMPRANAEFIRNVFVALPSEIEQQKIANYLDKMCAEIDTVLEKTRASIEEYKKLKQAVITQAVTKGIRGDRPMKDSGIEWIGEIPAEWSVVKGRRLILATQNGLTRRNLEKSEGFIVLKLKNLDADGNIDYSEVNRVALTDEEKSKYQLCDGDFLFVRVNGSRNLVGKCAIYHDVGEIVAYNDHIIRVKLNDLCLKEYFHYYLLSIAGKREIELHTSTAAGQFTISGDGLRELRVVLPGIVEQAETVAYLDKKSADIDALVAKKQQYLTEIENYKKSLIYEYVTGKKEVLPL